MTDDNTMALSVHVTQGTATGFALNVDESTKSITMAIRTPNAGKAVSIPDDLARTFVIMALHQRDLLRARGFVDAMNEHGGIQRGQPLNVICTALWHAALNSTMKCFQDSASRKRLSADRVFGNDATQPDRQAFNHMRDMRNKHVTHDENDWMSATPFAVVSQPGCQPVVSDVGCIVVEGTDTANIERLSRVIDAALSWVNAEHDAQIEAIRTDLLANDHAYLVGLPEPTFDTPYAGSVRARRRT